MTHRPQYPNDRLLRAILREPVDRTPVWIMRQAGRYLPEYRAARERAGSFMRLCQTPELACEVTLQPVQRYALDAAILFSDILTIPDAMGLKLSVTEGEGPKFAHPIRSAEDIHRLSFDIERLHYVYETIRLVQHELDGRLPLIGFSGSPWTLAAYMLEGQSNPGFPKLQQLRETEPLLLHDLLDILAKSVSAHLNAQIEAGVQVVMIFDTWGGLLESSNYAIFSLAYIHQVILGLHHHYNGRKVPVILFTKGGHHWLEAMVETGCDGVGIDEAVSLKEARARIGHRVALQGNMAPALLLGSPDMIRQEVKRLLYDFGQGSGHIFNLGHGITRDVLPEQLAVLIDAVHTLSEPYHA